MSINDKLDQLKTIKSNIKNVIIEKGVEVTDTDSFNSYADKIKAIPTEGGDPYYEDLYNLRTSNGTNMAGLFAYTTADSLDLTELDVSQCTDMANMFANSNIKTLNIDGWDTSNVTNMSNMFNYLKDVNLICTNLNMENVTNMEKMFSYSKLNDISLIKKLKFPKVKSLKNVFDNFIYNGELDLSDWDTSNITNMNGTFNSLEATKLNLDGWNTGNVTDMEYMFGFAYNGKIESLIIPDWDMTKTTSYSSMFGYSAQYTANLKYIDLSRSNDVTISKIAQRLHARTEATHGEMLIPENTSQEAIDAIIAKYWRPVGPFISLNSFKIKPELDEIKPGKTTKMYIYDCVPWYGSKEDIEYVISDPTKLSIDENNVITGLSEGSVTVYGRLKSDNSIVSDTITITVSEVDSSPNVIKFRGTSTPSVNNYMIINGNNVRLSAMSYDTGTGIYTYDVGAPITSIRFNGSGIGSYGDNITKLIKINTSNITDMSYMFEDCVSLTSLDLSNWDTSNVTDMVAMFQGCNSLTSLDLSNFDTSNITSMNYIFQGCSKLTSLDLSNWDTSKVTDTSSMFIGVPSTATITVSNDTWTLTENETYFSGTFNRI